jgi:1-pyrroline-5-carboxylate dehydrogenase
VRLTARNYGKKPCQRRLPRPSTYLPSQSRGGVRTATTWRVGRLEVYDRFVERLVEKTLEIVKIGDLRRREVFLGPVINKSARENYRRYVADAVAAGGRLRYGGRIVEEGKFSKGFYVEPAIIEGVAPDSYLWKTELFLPILLVDKFDTLEETLREANDTEYDLTAGIFSEDPGKWSTSLSTSSSAWCM